MNTTVDEIRILLVDDHEMMRQGLRQLIMRQPGLAVVGEASNSRMAMEQVRVVAPHLVLMDVHLPDESGVETARRILAVCPSVKVIALSGDSDLEIVVQALNAGVSGYIVKANGFEELIRAIHAAMDHRLYLSPEVSSAVAVEFMKTMGDKTVPARVALTDRERLLVKLVAEGKRSKEIADILDVGAKSVETFRARLMKKLRCAGTAELIRYAIREGIIMA